MTNRNGFVAIARRLTPLIAWVLTGVKGRWQGCEPVARRRVYFANHSSHADFILIWSALPTYLRPLTRPVAGADYWLKGPLRRFIGCRVFNAVMVERRSQVANRNWLDEIKTPLEQGSSLIIFPEGTRNTTDEAVLPFKSGIYHLGRLCPDIEFVPVWVENVNRVLPKGDFLPLPLLCSVTFGAPLRFEQEDTKPVFLRRARDALMGLAPDTGAAG